MSCRGEAYVVEIASCSTTCDNSNAREILPLFAAVEALRGKDGAGMETIEIVDNKIRVTMTDGRILETDTISAGLADKELSQTSGNPVQNRVLYAKFAEERERSEKAYDKKDSAKNALTDAKKYTDDREAVILSVVGNKVDKVSNKGLSTNDYTNTEKQKLQGIEANAQKNVQPDWNETDSSKASYIKNKPTISGGGEVVSGVSGVKGDAESKYRVGDVNITPANLGLGNVENTADKDKNVATSVKATQDSNGNIIAATYATKAELGGKQDTLISSTNIKTINNESILGSGNITISGGGSNITVDDSLSSTSTNPVQNKVITKALGGKQDTISDLATIRSGAGKGASAIQRSDLATVATSGSYNDLLDKPTIPSEVTEFTVSGWGFTKNTGTYSKPSGGIPKSDLGSAVQNSLKLADSALQSYTEKFQGTVTGVKINGATKNPDNNGVVDLGDIGGSSGYAGMPVVEVNSQLTVDYSLQPNTYYRLNRGASGIHFTLATPTDNTIVNEYVVEFSSVAYVGDIYFTPSIVWANGEAPTFENPTVISIINGLGVWSEFY